VVGPILVILAEDETKVRSHVAWKYMLDALTGFCGHKENHEYISIYRVHVGFGEVGYNRIMDAFTSDKVSIFARVIMVCLLHSKLPRLVLT
jgi:hypothetical protein